jgi:methylase of polypeptide subunit release factors
MDDRQHALADLLTLLRRRGYAFVTPTPATHARVVARRRAPGRDLRDAFGWSLPFDPETAEPDVVALLSAAGAVEEVGERLRASVRVSSRGERLFVHSAYPTTGDDAVFFGPDSYRFADLIERERRPARRVLDIGAGSGIGGISAAVPGAEVVLADPNPAALRLAEVNAADARVPVTCIATEGCARVEGAFDLILTNPPYILDPCGPAYRSGGDMHGGALTVELAREALERLAPGGRMIVYSGSAILGGRDRLRDALAALGGGFDFAYRELDPDVFGEELDGPGYAGVERIAAVAAIFDRR